ncbi:MAG: response regulator transcription factor [Clostridia bacterium]|nr:response regulator transcription factor [Clostridia bacterium]
MSLNYLIVEDSVKISDGICEFFTDKSQGGIVFEQAFTGTEGLRLINENQYDLIILDIMLPGASGFELCKAVRKTQNTPIIFLTSLGSEESILKGYELGADDYVVKPFNVKTLYAKAEAMVKRFKGDKEITVLKREELELNTYTMEVTINGSAVNLSPKEYFLLKILMENPEKVFSRNQLLDIVWEYDFDGTDRVVDNHIKKLRQSLGKSGKRLVTVYGRGYKII